ncbi:hypothetical protein BVER_04561c [Candidatus Burkholderia verschuerenii]|uniref:Uncharacterized protein n=1 Tax=Candidatus Burkholderia verschuerenii TaxID=242163 RepID=A0A0L0MAX4_9BURK|nr:DUF4279 domain-containing protein [Candidatus Burkholderia verschuerenii]KND59877.1 hypothetical protein BVER_04561c [Candidatus Burkholderia verschuerenii]
MNAAVLWVRGEQSAVDHVLNQLGLTPQTSWKKGDVKRRDAFHTMSGFGIDIADAKTPREMCDSVRAMLSRCKALSIPLRGADFAAELSLGVSVGTQDQFVAAVEFTAEDLSLMGELGVRLSVVAYPSSDDNE